MINYLKGVDTGSVADAYARAAVIVKDSLGGFRDRELEDFKAEKLAKAEERDAEEFSWKREANENEAINRQAVLDTTNTYNEVLSGERLDNVAAANNKKAAIAYMTKNKIDPNSDQGWGSEKVQDIIKSNNEKERVKFLADPRRIKNVLENIPVVDSVYDKKSNSFVGYNAIDPVKQLVLKKAVLEPIDKEVDRLDKLKDFATTLSLQTAKEKELVRYKAGFEASKGKGSADKDTDSQKMFNRLAPSVALEKFNRLSKTEKAAYDYNPDTYLAKNYSELMPAVYQKMVTINQGKDTKADFSSFVSSKVENADDVNTWINDRLAAMAQGNKTFTKQDLYNALLVAPQKLHYNFFAPHTVDIDTNAATTSLQAAIDAYNRNNK